MTGEEFRLALTNGTNVFGTLIVADSPYWPKIVAGIHELDFVFIDTEHTPIDRNRLSWMCRTYAALGLPPMVRIPEPSPAIARTALDAGATCIVAPYVETRESVEGLVGAVKYGPIQGATLDSFLHGVSPAIGLADYIETYNCERSLVINIESVPAIENLDELLSVPGLDGILIGPHDLSCSLGIPEQYDHPRFVEAVDGILTRAGSHGLGAGIHYTFLDHGLEAEHRWIEMGANLVVHSADVIAIRMALRSELSELRAAHSRAPEEDVSAGRVNI